MIVTPANIHHVLGKLRPLPTLALDTETTGLRPYHGDDPFGFILSDGEDSYYFDLGHYFGYCPDLEVLRSFFLGPRYWFLANAKFDMAMMAKLGIELLGDIHDLQAYERVLDSNLFGRVFSLGAIAARYGREKSGAVDAYIEEHGLYTVVAVEGKKTKDKLKHFDRVPHAVLIPYAEQDARETFIIGQAQLRRVDAVDLDFERRTGSPELRRLADNERELIRTVYEMERVGVQIDVEYCRHGVNYEADRRRRMEAEFEKLAGRPWKDSAKSFEGLFDARKLLKTPKGAPSYAAESLALVKNELSECILGIRDAKSRMDYFNGFLHHADAQGAVHASFNQHQARTGRFSSSAPNLQNMTRPEEGETPEEFPVRRAIIPRPGFFFAMFDFDQMEYRLMLEYARALPLIEKVLGGLDVHEATAQLAGISRTKAKTTNFLSIYGGGDAVLAQKLGCTVTEAKAIRASVFRAAPEIRDLIQAVIQRATTRGYVYNWFGRRLYFPDPEEAYRAPNHLIQGGCADVVKVAMNGVAAFLQGHKSRLVLTVHDELVVECAFGEEWALPYIQQIMEKVYPAKLIPLTCGVDYSQKSLADKIEGFPGILKPSGER